jgi:hypothetical protein
MRALALSVALAGSFISQVFAYGQEGHSIIAEIAQVRLSADAAKEVGRLLKGRSLASIASWADDVHTDRPATYRWHFVGIPRTSDTYDPSRDCKEDPARGDCIVAELDRLKNDVRCAPDNDFIDANGETRNQKVEALKFAVHFVGDIHQHSTQCSKIRVPI